MFTKLIDIASKAKTLGRKTRIAVASAEDSNTLGAIVRATREGFIRPILLGNANKIKEMLTNQLDLNDCVVIDFPTRLKPPRKLSEW
jgi:phosphate butyryltransferase